jgi:hypothetical protein
LETRAADDEGDLALLECVCTIDMRVGGWELGQTRDARETKENKGDDVTRIAAALDANVMTGSKSERALSFEFVTPILLLG